MPNGTMLRTLQRIVDSDKTIPEYIRYIVAAEIDIINRLELLATDVSYLKDDNETVKLKSERNITWPWIKDNIVTPILRTAITLALGYIFLKVTGVAP